MTTANETAPDAQARSILLICTRDPRGKISGRKMVLRTIISALIDLGHTVTVASFGPAEAPVTPRDSNRLRYVALVGPSRAEQLIRAARWLLFGDMPLNEALYRGRRARAALENLARETGAEIVITDMLRTADYGERLGLPWIADLDDLLSRRYRLLAANFDADTNLIGYYQSAVGRFAQKFGSRLMPWILRREAAAIARREIEVANTADVTTLVSAAEARTLSTASKRPVRPAPMAVTGPQELPTPGNRLRELVFLGGMDYGPNLKSVQQFDREIVPKLVAQNIADPRLHVIGTPGEKIGGFSDAVIFEGYVDDLDAAMQQYQAMLIPAVLPGGVKTKIIVAAMNGTLALAHPSAVDGMDLRDGCEVMLWSTADELAALIHRLRCDDIDLAALASAARAWAEKRHSPAALRAIWRQLVSDALTCHWRDS